VNTRLLTEGGNLGFEEAFAPEIAMFTNAAKMSPFEDADGGPSTGALSPSWMPASMQTPPRAMSPTAGGPGDGPAGSSGATGVPQRAATTTAGGRNEKHRLSLTFLRRASVGEAHHHHHVRGIGGTNGSIDARVAQAGGPGAAAAAAANTSSAGAVAPHHNAHLADVSGEADGEDRPATRESMDHSIRSRVGSVKKRLSLLGMGGHGSVAKKGKGQGVVGVVEESGEE
jgi:hypothetical protein